MSCDLKSSFLPGFTNAKKNANFSALSFEFVDFPHEITETNWLIVHSQGLLLSQTVSLQITPLGLSPQGFFFFFCNQLLVIKE